MGLILAVAIARSIHRVISQWAIERSDHRVI
jgi:hypothetical protein